MNTLLSLGWNAQLQSEFVQHASHWTPARVIAVDRDSIVVATDATDPQTHRRATLAGRFRHLEQVAIAVGDWVGLTDSRVEHLFARKSAFARKRVGEASGEQVIAANVDWTFITMSLNDDFSPRRAERIAVAAWDAGTTPVIVLTKADLSEDQDAAVRSLGPLCAGCQVLAVSVVDDTGVAKLKATIERGQTAVLVGSSGVGKSSLVNALLGQEQQVIAAIREADGKGRHTTTRRELLAIPDTGGLIIDTPGMREFGVLGTDGDRQGLEQGFADIEELARQCGFGDCGHQAEPDCAVKEAIEDGTIDDGRLANYFKLRREIAYNESRGDAGKKREVNKLWRQRSREYRQRTKNSPKS